MDDPESIWPLEDLVDAMGLTGATKRRLLDQFAGVAQNQVRLRELMDMCLDGPLDALGFTIAPLLRVRGVGKKGFWSVVNGLTGMDLGPRCNAEWQQRLVTVKQQSGTFTLLSN